MKCKYCGEDFEVNKYGRKKVYCNKKECISEAKKEAQKKWYAKKMKALNGVKSKIIEDNDGKKIVYSSTDRAINSMYNEDFSKVIELARKLGAVRFEITEEIKKCGPEISAADKEKEIFMHNIESLANKETVSKDEIVEIVVNYFNKSQNRRVVKDKVKMLDHLTRGCIQNPSAYITEFIKNRNNRTYNPDKRGVKK